MNFSDLITEARSRVDEDLQARKYLSSRISTTEEQVIALKEQVDILDKTAMLLNTLGEERQQEAQAMIENLVTRGLQTIFEPNISLVISTSVRGRTTNTEFLVRTEFDDGTSFETSVMDARGGGLVAVVAFLLRVTVLLLTQEKERFLLLDETFAHVSAEYQPGVGKFLRDLVDDAGLQIVLVTHSEEFAEYATSVLHFDQVNGKTTVLTAP